MTTRRIVTLLLCTAAAGLLLLAGTFDVQVSWRDNDARALDFFGSKDKESDRKAGAFWKESSGAEPIVPVGVPSSFADLAERASPGVVNIATSKTVTGHTPRFEDFF